MVYWLGRSSIHRMMVSSNSARISWQQENGVGICPRTLERQTIIVSMCNNAYSVRSNPDAGFIIFF